jgi:glycerol kinase
MTRGTNRAHFCRAALESIAFQGADLIGSMERDSGLSLSELRVDGGAARSRPLLQFQADLLQQRVIRPKCIETTAMGAAYLAGLAVGFWEDRHSITENWETDVIFKPQRSDEAMESLRKGWAKALERSKNWEEAAE